MRCGCRGCGAGCCWQQSHDNSWQGARRRRREEEEEPPAVASQPAPLHAEGSGRCELCPSPASARARSALSRHAAADQQYITTLLPAIYYYTITSNILLYYYQQYITIPLPAIYYYTTTSNILRYYSQQYITILLPAIYYDTTTRNILLSDTPPHSTACRSCNWPAPPQVPALAHLPACGACFRVRASHARQSTDVKVASGRRAPPLRASPYFPIGPPRV